MGKGQQSCTWTQLHPQPPPGVGLGRGGAATRLWKAEVVMPLLGHSLADKLPCKRQVLQTMAQ